MIRHRRGTEESDSSRSRSPSPFHPDSKGHRNEPFFLILLKVGATLLVLCVLGYIVALLKPRHDSQYNFRDFRLKPINPETDTLSHEENVGLDELPELQLKQQQQLKTKDAFQIATEYLQTLEQSGDNTTTNYDFAYQAKILRASFVHKYGDETAARYLLQESIKTWTANNIATNTTDTQSDPAVAWIHLFQRAQQQQRLTIAFIGQSTTAGYGNHHKDSFPFVVESLLQPLLKVLGIELIVRNHAMEHIGPFPYTWCIRTYIGDDVDIISWDFGPSTPLDLEIWLRAVLSMDHTPMLLFRDSFAAGGRHKIVQNYVDANVLHSPTVFDWEDAVKPFLQVKPSKRPAGFANWNTFGGPPGVQALPGQIDKPNWTIRQHALAGDILVMWLLGHVELMVAAEIGTYALPAQVELSPLHVPIFATSSQLKQPYSHLLYFSSPSELSCYTTFDPALSGQMSLIASGIVDAPLLDPKGAIFYNHGWVLDLESTERKEKLLTREWEFLGMTDTQKSFHGVKASGTLAMRLELSNGPLELLVLCENHSPPQQEACVLGHDVNVAVNGEKAPNLTRIDSDAVSYNGKRLCYLVTIPEDLPTGDVELEISVSNALVTWAKGPCTISHVIWKERKDGSSQR